MRHAILTLTLGLSLQSTPMSAQTADGTDPPADAEISEGFSLMEEGARLLFRGLMSEMEPAIDGLSELADEMQPALERLAEEFGPALGQMLQTIDDIRHYEAPEVLPNGDIILRRRPDAPEFTPRESEPIDL